MEEIKETASEMGRELHSNLVSEADESEEMVKIQHRRRNILGVILIILGIVFLVGSFNLFWWFRWYNLWPLILITGGVLVIFSVKKRS